MMCECEFPAKTLDDARAFFTSCGHGPALEAWLEKTRGLGAAYYFVVPWYQAERDPVSYEVLAWERRDDPREFFGLIGCDKVHGLSYDS